MNTHVIADTKCPTCGHPIDRSTGIKGEEAPEPGDDGLVLLTESDYSGLDTETQFQLQRVKQAIQAIQRQNERR